MKYKLFLSGLIVVLAGICFGLCYQFLFITPATEAAYLRNRLLFSAILTPIIFLAIWRHVARLIRRGTEASPAEAGARAALSFTPFFLAPILHVLPLQRWTVLLLIPLAIVMLLARNGRALAHATRSLLRQMDGPRWFVLGVMVLAIPVLCCEINENFFNWHNGEGHYGLFAKNFLKLDVSETKFLFTYYAKASQDPNNPQQYLGHPPLSSLIIACSYLYFGINEWATRLPTLVLFWLSLFLIYRIAAFQIGRGLAAFVIPAALVFPMSLYYGGRPWLFCPMYFFSLLALLTYIRFTGTRKTTDFLWMFLWTFLATYSDWPGLMFMPFVFLHYAVFHARSRRDLYHLVLMPACCLLILAVIYYHLCHIGGGWADLVGRLQERTSANTYAADGGWSTPFTLKQWLERQLEFLNQGYTPIFVLLGLFWSIAAIFRALARGFTPRDGLSLVLLGWAAFYLILFRSGSFFHDLYSYMAIAWFAISPLQLAYWGMEPLPAANRRRAYGAVYLLYGCIMAVAVSQCIPTISMIRNRMMGGAELEPALKLIEKHNPDNATILGTVPMYPGWRQNRLLWMLNAPYEQFTTVRELQQQLKQSDARFGIFGPDYQPLTGQYEIHGGHTSLAPEWGTMPADLSREILARYATYPMGDYAVVDFKQSANLHLGLDDGVTTANLPINRAYTLVGYRLPAKVVPIREYGRLDRYLTSINYWYWGMSTPVKIDYFFMVNGAEGAETDIVSCLYNPFECMPFKADQDVHAMMPSRASILNIFKPARFLKPGTIFKATFTHYVSHQAPKNILYNIALGPALDQSKSVDNIALVSEGRKLEIKEFIGGIQPVRSTFPHQLIMNSPCNINFNDMLAIRFARLQVANGHVSFGCIAERHGRLEKNMMLLVRVMDDKTTLPLVTVDHPVPKVNAPGGFQYMINMRIDEGKQQEMIQKGAYATLSLIDATGKKQPVKQADRPRLEKNTAVRMNLVQDRSEPPPKSWTAQ